MFAILAFIGVHFCGAVIVGSGLIQSVHCVRALWRCIAFGGCIAFGRVLRSGVYCVRALWRCIAFGLSFVVLGLCRV